MAYEAEQMPDTSGTSGETGWRAQLSPKLQARRHGNARHICMDPSVVMDGGSPKIEALQKKVGHCSIK